ncbi:MAG: ISAs1 family transposase [Leptolyngbya sp. SIOISBB]|nr:ISAs1 family transposase [Leptolyngbya sp. SIOISBB]
MSLHALINDLKTIPDWRRGCQPVDYPLWSLLLLSLLSAMSGYTSLRGMSDFMARHYRSVMMHLGSPHESAPAYGTVRRMTQWVDGAAVTQCFERWAQAEAALSTAKGLAIDGKVLGSTVSDCHGAQQDYISVVSACVHEHGWVAAQVSFALQESNEIAAVRALLKHLEVKGAWLTLDALHCQKNG